MGDRVLLQAKLYVALARSQALILDRSHAGIPTEDGIVVAGGSHDGGLFIPLHGVAEPVIGE